MVSRTRSDTKGQQTSSRGRGIREQPAWVAPRGYGVNLIVGVRTDCNVNFQHRILDHGTCRQMPILRPLIAAGETNGIPLAETAIDDILRADNIC